MMYSLLFVCACCVASVLGYGTGPPPSVCQSMLPNHHGSTPQSSSSPYEVTVDKTKVDQGSTITVTLTGSEEFKGFMVEARTDSNNEALGTFTQNGGHKYLSCGRASQNAVTHGNPAPKSTVTMEWRAPSNYEGEVKLRATVVKDMATFWVDIESDAVRVERQLSFPGNQQPTTTTTTTTTTTKPNNANEALVEGFYSTCGSTHGCFGPETCIEEKDCKMAAAYRKRSDGKYEIQLTGEAPGYVAVGFSDDASMGEDAVIHCVNEGGEIKAHKSYNVKGRKSNERLQTQTGLSEVSGRYADGILSCKFVLDPKLEIPDKTFDLNEEKYHILVAASNEKSGFHNLGAFPSRDEISISEASVAAAKSDTLIKIHGALMIAAWVGSASCGIVMARYMKKVWPGKQFCGKDLWFQRHRLNMGISWFMTMVSFIIIFVELQDWTSQPTNPHAYLGVITTVLCFIQPIMALFRCGPTDSKRPIFNWAHWSVGNTAHICGMIAILFATKLNKALLPNSFFWVMVAFVVIYVLFHILFSVLDWLNCHGSFAKCSPGTEGTGEVIGMHYRGTNGHNASNGAQAVEDGSPKNGWVQPQPDTKRGETYKKCVFFIFELVIWVFAAVLIYLTLERPGVDVK